MKNKKQFSLLFITGLALSFMAMPSCHNDNKVQINNATEKQEANNIEGVDIAKMIQDYDNYYPYDPQCDSTLWAADCKRIEEYWKQPCLYLAPNVERYLDSIAEITGIPNYNDYDGRIVETVKHAVHELRRYQISERLYYPENEVKDAISSMFSGFSNAVGHADEGFYYMRGHYFHCFATQAALLCPNVEFICETHSEDHQVGLLTCWSNAGPLMVAMIYKSAEYCTFQLVDFDMVLGKIFQIKDSFGNDYYMLTSGFSSNEFYYIPVVYLYEIRNEVLLLAVKYNIPYSEMVNGIDVRDDAECIYNPIKHQWDLCVKKGEYWHKIEGTKSLYLHLDKEKPYFEVH